MIKSSKFILALYLCLFHQLVLANTKATVFWFDELDAGIDPVQVRYLVTTKYLRIDNGGLQDNFILFDAANKIIYSVNHEDKTILVIKNNNNQSIDKIEVYNLLGQIVTTWKNIETKFENRISTKNLAASIYIIKVFTDNGIISKKISVNNN